MIRVGVVGAAGRMGAEVCRAVAADDELELVAAVDPAAAGTKLTEVTGVGDELVVAGELEELGLASAEVVVDFTVAPVARRTLGWLADRGIHAVVGTTGFSDEDLATFRAAFTDSNCLIAPNFAIGAILMMRFAASAAEFFETAEIIEFHHDAKRDAPSGTALHTAEMMVAASPQWAPDPTVDEVVTGARGGDVGGVRVHSVRMKGMVAHQEVVLGTTGQTLTIRHDSYDRTSFMPGVLLAAKRIGAHRGVTIGLEPLLGL